MMPLLRELLRRVHLPMQDIRERFWSKVNKSGPNGCWVWTASVDSNGYGKIFYQGKLIRASRMVWFLMFDEWPEAVLHRCDNPPCVNPAHLFKGTQSDNLSDMRQKGRHRYEAHSGVDNGRAKVTEEQVKQIRELCKRGDLTQREIGKLFGLSNQMVSRIAAQQAWKCDLSI